LSKLRILITNDDGLNSRGIAALVKALRDTAELYVLAPDRQRSLVSHSLTLRKPLKLKEKKDHFGPGFSAYVLNGMPADCVKVGIRTLMRKKPDLVISGINEEPNLGTDVVYSGTVSAAREAVLEGIPGLAVSIAKKKKTRVDFTYAAEFIKELVLLLEAKYWRQAMLLNINIPDQAKRFGLADLRITRLGERKYVKILEKKTDRKGEDYYLMSGELIAEKNNLPESDVRCVLSGKVSLTPLQYDYTHHEEIAVLRKKLNLPQRLDSN